MANVVDDIADSYLRASKQDLATSVICRLEQQPVTYLMIRTYLGIWSLRRGLWGLWTP